MLTISIVGTSLCDVAQVNNGGGVRRWHLVSVNWLEASAQDMSFIISIVGTSLRDVAAVLTNHAIVSTHRKAMSLRENDVLVL